MTRRDLITMFEAIHLASREGSRGADGGPRFFFLFLLLLLAGVLVAKAIRRRKYGESHHVRGSAMQTLQDRFARGEIDHAEYDHRKAVLDGADVVPPAPTPVTTVPAPPDDPSTPSSGGTGTEPSDEDA